MAKHGKAKRTRKYPAETSAPPRRTVTINRLFDRRTGEPVGMAESTDWSDVERELDAWIIGALNSPEAKAGSEAGGIVIVRGMAEYPGGSFHPSVIEQVRVWVCDAVARVLTSKGEESKSFPADFGKCEIEMIYKSTYDITEEAAGLRGGPATEPEQVTRPVHPLRGPHFERSNENILNHGNKSSEHLGCASRSGPTTEGSKLSEGSPEDYDRIVAEAELRLVAVADHIDASRQHFRAELEDAVNDYLRTRNLDSPEAKKQYADQTRGLLDRLGFAVEFDGQRCSLYFAFGKNDPKGRFRIIPKGSSKYVMLSEDINDLLPLKLVSIPSRSLPPSLPEASSEEPSPGWRDRLSTPPGPAQGR